MKTIKDILDAYFHDLAILELKFQNNILGAKKLSFNSLMYLDIIRNCPDKYTVSDIAEILEISKPSVTQKIKELEQLGYVKKVQSETDKRVFYLAITDEIQKVESIFEDAMKTTIKELQKEYTETEINQSTILFDKLCSEFIKNLKIILKN
ncbi:hypothetical protein AN639_06925 [Candidatus Epulonipiscium fishelsonii]|uniref:Uncharacterized protein n=1 Tax=Candidatus Epulonipiscium fishelsonii TaxID=77094 RepID=A0ACC8XB68_9FIRM|nr:hypothetical protein AN639_06925 [Epulopiscium sp. SCG-B05WGA-EpuloA1]ONI39658.1 hypothetical protein AN396_07835 [Epulopiscium sp. SCG-B11WGA-EpuloA1]ONI47517.1 hypothetical protein AN644_05050 [Epulopiscium sp. SCG-C06WGA-EpuloA1]